MKQIDLWPVWQWVLFTNAVAAMGVYFGFGSSGVKLSGDLRVYIAVPTVVFLNLIFLVVRPRIVADRTAGRTGSSAIGVLYRVLAERPLLTALCILQLVGASRAAAATIQILQASTSGYVRSLPNSESAALRLTASSILMGSVALLWFLGAVGLWLRRSWAWWLALVLNSLATVVSGIVQLARLDERLFDIWAILAVVLLLLRPIRNLFHPGQMADQSPETGRSS
jgi:hypothetical protein